ncbi:extracellular solute-binding protein [Micromonospora tulbaghiae]|uniref:Carbohydrate ABC transporter substrate-binding protein, CUT1 family n=1 Tax=Micromonospora tulbaghiae TaxID=479978 RepID=A0AAW4JE09_9ACTN|nr:extracellular solute-binding protein [Micromonospora tulbaghiae]MBO4139794.1 extracellular solute-binding protein [Micromonospora tulbaghiae]MDX5458754.1 extracellular solute-binding protein [Micromonospora tulbaghiae]SCE78335.1 carbohydrate ABC transporter substrate-binding protein, CUT1 family [Micromonospora tulbaghiae]
MSRKLRATALAGVLTLAISGCGGVGGGGDSGGGGAEGSGALSTMGFSLSDEIATTRVDAFKRDHGDVRLTITEGAFDEQQFLSAVASGNPPDLVYMDRKLIGTYAERGSIQPLTDCVEKQRVDMAEYRQSAREQVTLDGTVYGIPEFSQVRVLYLNEALLKRAGLGADDVNLADWAGLPALNARLAAVSGGRLSRIGIDPKIPEFLPMWAKANGADMISADGTRANLTDPKVVEALTTGVGLIQAQGGWGKFKSFRDTFDFFGAQNPLAKNQIAAWPMEEWFLNQAAKNSPDAELVVKPFVDRQGKPLSLSSGQAWVVTKGAKNPEAACAFVKQMTATDTWLAAARARAEARKAANLPFTGLWTGNTTADKKIFDEVYKPTGNKRFDDAVQTIRQAQDAAFAMPASPAGAEFDKAWTDAVNRVLSGQEQPAQALDRAQREATAALDKAAD